MRATELIDVVAAYVDALNAHPATWEVRQGCDCGCGGDSITDEEWEGYDEALADARHVFDELCVELDIEIDI